MPRVARASLCRNQKQLGVVVSNVSKLLSELAAVVDRARETDMEEWQKENESKMLTSQEEEKKRRERELRALERIAESFEYLARTFERAAGQFHMDAQTGAFKK
jgi:uncharacterized protein with von Willebrand factor type A (vWA) domain